MKVLIVEDETRIAKRIVRMTKEYFGGILETINVLDSIASGMDYIHKAEIDLILLDLNLNGADGFEILKSAVAESFDTIIISAHREQALTAFEHGVLDFVPKPFNRERLNQAFHRIVSKGKRNANGIQFLAVKKRGSINLTKIEDILYIKGAGVYTELSLNNGNRELYNKSLEKLEQLLPSTFERIHKSYIVKMTKATRIIIHSGSKYQLEMKNGELLPIGRTKYREVREKWF